MGSASLPAIAPAVKIPPRMIEARMVMTPKAILVSKEWTSDQTVRKSDLKQDCWRFAVKKDEDLAQI